MKREIKRNRWEYSTRLEYIDQFIQVNAKSHRNYAYSLDNSLFPFPQTYYTSIYTQTHTQTHTLEMDDNVIRFNWICFALNIMYFYYIEPLLCSFFLIQSINGNSYLDLWWEMILYVYLRLSVALIGTFRWHFYVYVGKFATYFTIIYICTYTPHSIESNRINDFFYCVSCQ